jgi:polyisoprenoid-binding protein YceI
MNRCLLGLIAAAIIYAGCDKPKTTVGPVSPPPNVASTWVGIDRGYVTLADKNTKITFTAGKHAGGFNSHSGKVRMAQLQPGKSPLPGERGILASVDVDIDTDSLFITDDPKLTEQIKEELKAKEHPKISFTSTKVKTPDSKEEEMVITGNLTIAGQKKEISFPAKASKEGSALWMKGGFKIKKSELGLKGDEEIAIDITIGADPNAKSEK